MHHFQQVNSLLKLISFQYDNCVIPSAAELQKKFAREVSEVIIPRIKQDGAQRLILGEPLLNVPPEVRLSPYPLPPLHISGEKQDYFVVGNWVESKMVSPRFPTLSFVLRGEIDMRLGSVATDPAQQTGADGQLLSGIKAGTAILVPAGKPCESKKRWWSRDIMDSYDETFQILVLPEGVRCHISRTYQGEIDNPGWLLAYDAKILDLTERLIKEIKTNSPYTSEITQSLYLAIFLIILRALEAKRLSLSRLDLKLDAKVDSPMAGESSSRAAIFERASQYIRDNIAENLSVHLIANYAAVSSTELNRIFREAARTSVMQFVKQRRMETACFYLERSRLPIADIARLTGYARSGEFSRAFVRHAGVAPLMYRKHGGQKLSHQTRP